MAIASLLAVLQSKTPLALCWEMFSYSMLGGSGTGGSSRLMKDRILLLLLVVVYLLYTTVFPYISEVAPYSRFLKGWFLGAFFLGAILIVGFRFSGRILSGEAQVIFVLYALFIAYSVALCFTSEAPIKSFTESIKYYVRIGFFFALVIWARSLKDRDWIVGFPIVLGVILAVQSLLLYVLLMDGVELERNLIHIIDGSEEGYLRSYGILGLGIAIDPLLRNWFSVRLQSFFLEPSKFAMFLVYPIFVSYGLYRIRRQKRFLGYAVLMMLAFIGTFSLGGYAAMGGAGLVLVYFSVRPKIPSELRWAVVAMGVVIVLCIGVQVFNWSANYVPAGPGDFNYNRLLGFASSSSSGGSLGERRRVDSLLLSVFASHPFGLSFINQYDSPTLGFGELGTTNAAMFILTRTGVVGAILFTWIFSIVFYRFMLPQLRRDCLGRYVCVGTLAVWLHSISYGTWLDVNFFYPLALVVALRRYCIEDQAEEVDGTFGGIGMKRKLLY